MWMFIERWKESHADEQWLDGYDWAAGILLRGEQSPTELDVQLWRQHHPFDRGAIAAIERLRKEEL